MPYTYLLECVDGTFYVGSTRNLDQRMQDHYLGSADGYTSKRRPVRLVWFAECDRIDEAYALERKIKGWRRAKRVALIEGRFTDLPGLSRTSRARGDSDGGQVGR
ncbi:GIY-YIG nuclease family protein [Microlunatus speluncae]|uniref:GIY-YIG nuclease family protein n=1 Tax=Microlunatus speluncae TaxID=2594267 RepID=UPI0012666417|nr:GIY-YIG nuclease family protein [Microlunatus speluncae]